MEFEDDDVENDDWADGDEAQAAGYTGGVAERIEENFSIKSEDPQTIFVMTRSYGARPAFIHEFKINTSEEFYKFTSSKARKHILENNSWSERLLGDAVPNGFSLSAFIEELKVKEVGILSYYRERVTYGINLGIKEIMKFLGKAEFEQFGITYASAIDLIRKDEASAEELEQNMEAYGKGVRAGVVTANETDEIHFRTLLKVPEAGPEVAKAWKEDGGIRRPVTLKGSDDSATEKTRNNEKPDNSVGDS
jgi:hypothetical protein